MAGETSLRGKPGFFMPDVNFIIGISEENIDRKRVEI